GTQTLLATNRSEAAREEIVLRLLMNGEAEDSVAVSGVTADGQSVSARAEADEPTVLRVAYDWQPGQTVELSWTVMARHPKGDGASAVTLPVLALCTDGVWQTDAYDALAMPGCAEAFDVSLTLTAPDTAKAVFGPALIAQSWETGVGETTYTAQMRGARDVSFALMSGGALRQREVGGVLVSAMGKSVSEAKALLSCAEKALESLEEAGFPYPLASLSLAQAEDALQDGEAYSGLALLSAQGKDEELTQRVTRLAARQTFGVLVGADAWNEPWLSRSLAAAAELLAYRARRGEAAYEERYFETIDIASRLTRPAGVTVGASVDRFGGDAEMTQVLRDQGAAMLMGIEEAVGREAFAQALALYVSENAGQIASREDVEAALLAATGSSWSGYLEDELTF
ncbi:MAG: M1 family aminopeptidase, partial [Clostridia bacterium]|nr:M1 family aminopeptidase [Clostridia bacterium]